MSDNIIRICNQHGQELRLIGAAYVCPFGHDAGLDWHVRETLPFADPVKRRCPIHGKPLIGPGPTVECTHDGQKFTLARAQAPQETPMPQPTPTAAKPAIASKGADIEHGTAKGYWRKCRCQPCKTAITEYLRDKNGKGAARTFARATSKHIVKATRRPKPIRPAAATISEAVDSLVRLSATVKQLERELKEAQAALAARVVEILPSDAISAALASVAR